MAVYYVFSGAGGSNNGSSWANAFTTLTTAFATEVAGDTLYVAHDHAESTAGSLTLTSSGTVSNPTKVICVNRAGSVPPVAADLRATAQVTCTGTNDINLAGFTHYDGIIFNAATGGGSGFIVLTNADGIRMRLDNCSLRANSTLSGGISVGGSTIEASYVELNNTTMSFGAIGHQINIAGTLKWWNTPSALSGTIPTNLFATISARGGAVECIGVDLSAAGSGKTIVNHNSQSTAIAFCFIDCKLNASVTKSVTPFAHGQVEIDFVRSGASGINYDIFRHRITGTLNPELTVVRTGGASDGTTPLAWKIDTTSNCNYSMSFECPPIAIWNDITGSSVMATVEGIWGGGAVPNDDDIWLDVEYLGDASSPMGSFINDGKANLLTTAAGQTSSSETWGGSTTKFKLAVSFTPQQKGWIYARVKVGKASSTFYIDPLVTLT